MNIIEVVLINWKRPDNIEKIIRALRSQTVPCTITICDCHQSSLFSLSRSAKRMADKIYVWKHNLGAFSRYLPIPSFDHPFTFFIDDDLLPGKKCLQAYLEAATVLPEFGVLGQFGRILSRDNIYRPNEIALTNKFIQTDFIVRAYFTRTRTLHNLIRFRHEIGYFDDQLPEDDLLLCASLQYYENLSCYLIPFNSDVETLVNKEELNGLHALSFRNEHYNNRNRFIKRIIFHGWNPLHLQQFPDNQTLAK